MGNINRFNIRVYGLWINKYEEVLVSDEYRFKQHMTKFPGGGLQFGEGIHDCLRREWKEELKVEIDIAYHFYTTDFFQHSAFNPSDQIISIYYGVMPLSNVTVNLKSRKNDIDPLNEGVQCFRFIPLEILQEEDLTFPIDKKVAGMLKYLKRLKS